MKFGDGFPIPREKEFQLMGPWMPVTPEKPIATRSNPQQVDRYAESLGRANWRELAGFPVGDIQETPNYNRAVPNLSPIRQGGQTEGYNGSNMCVTDRQRIINHIAASFRQDLYDEDGGWNNNQLGPMLARTNAAALNSANRNPVLSAGIVNRSQLLNSHSQASKWGDSSLSHLLLHNQTQYSGSNLLRNTDTIHQIPRAQYSGSDMLLNRDTFYQTPKAHHSGLNLLQNNDSFHQTPQYGFPVTYQPNYKQNSSSREEADAALSVTAALPFSPVTPDPLKKWENNQFSMRENLPMAANLPAEKDKQWNLVTSIGNETIQHNHNGILQNVVPSEIISTALEEKRDSENRSNDGIDLNKTPQQKPPKRRKHRPKVVKEGKPRGTPKAETPKSANPGGKRKYVRRKGREESATQKADIMRETTDASARPAERSCRRELNFDLENPVDESQVDVIGEQAEMQQSYKRTLNLNLDFQTTEIDSRTNSGGRAKLTLPIGQHKGLPTKNQQPGPDNGNTSMVNEIPAYMSMQEMQPVAASQPPRKDRHMENLKVNPSNIDTSIADPFQQCHRTSYTCIQQHTSAKGIGHTFCPENDNFENLGRTRQLITQCSLQSAPSTLFSSKEVGRSKRQYSHAMSQMQPYAVNVTGSSYLNQNMVQIDGCHRNTCMQGADCLETHKKKKIDSELRTIITGKPSGITAVQDGSKQTQSKIVSDVRGNGFMFQAHYDILQSCLRSSNISNREQGGYNKLFFDWNTQSMASNMPKQHNSSEKHHSTEKMGETNRLTSPDAFASSIPSKNCDLFPLTPPGKAPAPVDRQPKTCHTNISVKKNLESAFGKSVSSEMDQAKLVQREAFLDNQQYSAKKGGPEIKQIHPIPSVDEITHRFKDLNINQVQDQEQYAIVPFKQGGTVVPYGGFELIKKRKPRPKVDLDPETNRIWNLLMGKEGGEGLEETDKEKEKWWEEERMVFKGRADSFIARMHLVQGDRRFSKWKGSVVDSVIGVFLTQNVSDHLSSSAFMSLAARFPLKSNKRTCNIDGTNILVEEPEVCRQRANESIQWHELLRHPGSSQNSITPHELTEHQRVREMSGVGRTSLPEPHGIGSEEEIISSQDSLSSTILQSNGGIRSCSGSNSEAEDSPPGCKLDNGSANFQQVGNATFFQDFYSCINDSSLFQEGYHRFKQAEDRENFQQESGLESIDNLSSSLTFTQLLNFNSPQNQVGFSSNYEPHVTSYSELLEAEGSEIYNGECSSRPSTSSESSKAKNESYARAQQLAEDIGETMVQQNRLSTPEKMLSASPYVLLKKPTMQQPNASQTRGPPKYDQSCCDIYQHERRTFECENISIAEQMHHTDLAKEQNVPSGSMLAEKTSNLGDDISVANKLSDNKLTEPNSVEQVLSAHKVYDETNPKISKSKKRKADGEKKNAIDWESLRKQAQRNSGKQERSRDRMDSLDYEALRCANVKEISEAIKERGMNNMLAERMKEFLNRLVREHGSIDLEWLRDVPPDKAKDYLLSIRGLGLKSVECVRLLTLHHLAFPVDTNVGRIAVRLGWVPLQPLPESLQLHLLELYPVLESIQKYLWPRLCKLDQRTLYELHYQLITFGKVFCTKSKPNCNACPMRGECRHFASAFASARLALPGPEEKSIVSSTMPNMAERNPSVVINPMPLPSPEKSSLAEVQREISKCEPIIEEPATPEQECTEITESDIEDAFYEDPDEIPTIKLNIEEFSVNLQSYMQEKMELQECDLSKALVALNPDAASIPAPKLKNVSRLRTEHQVYELPDSHPLLEGMDRREPDDPSPYLLAIWTPGETANSIQLPERSCRSKKSGKLCDEKTCFSCNSIRETNSQTVRGTLLIPCRTAMRGSFPLNGTYFQVNEVFADHDSSLNPIDVPREWLWNLPRRMVYFGTSVSSIFKGLSTEGIQFCFWKGFVCVRGFDQKSRAPRPLMARLHFPASKLVKAKNENKP